MYFPTCFLPRLENSLISVLFIEPLYGKAAFAPGAEEVDDTTAPAKSNPATTPEMSAADLTKLENIAEGYSAMQKGLFFVVILSCVALYVRVTSKKAKRYPEKSMV